MQLSVIILNYNVRYHLELCILSVSRALENLNAEIIVVDNASTDSSLTMLSERFPHIKTIINTENLGFSKANNLGVKAATGDYVCILNPDTVVPENCFEDLLQCAAGINKLGVLGIRLIDGTGHFLPESKRNIPTPRVALAKLLQRPKLYYANHLTEGEEGEVEVLVGAFMFLKREVYLKLDGFDEDYFMYGEDIDLSYRLLQAGYTNYYCGKIQAIHFKGESTLRNKLYAKRFYEAMGIFYGKHFGTTPLKKQMVDATLCAAKNLKSLRSLKSTKDAQLQPPVLISSTDAIFIDKLKLSFSTEADCCTDLPDPSKEVTKKMLVLDAGSFSFNAIINCMNTCNHLNSSFRIRPPDCDFILGSDSSTRQGNVIFLED